MITNRDDFFKDEPKLKTEKVKIGPDKEVIVTELSGQDYDDYEVSSMKGGASFSLVNARARLIVRCVVDEAGARIFTDEDADRLGKYGASVIKKLAAAAERLNKMTVKDMEEMKGNS